MIHFGFFKHPWCSFISSHTNSLCIAFPLTVTVKDPSKFFHVFIHSIGILLFLFPHGFFFTLQVSADTPAYIHLKFQSNELQ